MKRENYNKGRRVLQIKLIRDYNLKTVHLKANFICSIIFNNSVYDSNTLIFFQEGNSLKNIFVLKNRPVFSYIFFLPSFDHISLIWEENTVLMA